MGSLVWGFVSLGGWGLFWGGGGLGLFCGGLVCGRVFCCSFFFSGLVTFCEPTGNNQVKRNLGC